MDLIWFESLQLRFHLIWVEELGIFAWDSPNKISLILGLERIERPSYLIKKSSSCKLSIGVYDIDKGCIWFIDGTLAAISSKLRSCWIQSYVHTN